MLKIFSLSELLPEKKIVDIFIKLNLVSHLTLNEDLKRYYYEDLDFKHQVIYCLFWILVFQNTKTDI